jgi:C-terminal processing protease CtpA/Prc
MGRAWRWQARVCLAILGVAAFCGPAAAQDKFDSIRRDQARGMLRDVYQGVKKNYYDAKFHGMDLEARYHAQDERIRGASSMSQSLGIIAGFLEPLDDSHTFFLPPPRPFHVEYGYVMQMVGDLCYITQVRPGTDAAAKLKPGDQVITLEGFTPDRTDLWKMNYYFNRLAPRSALHLVIRDPAGQQHQVEIAAKVKQEKRVLDLTAEGFASGGGDIWQLIREQENEEHLLRQRYYEPSDAVMLWKMPEFFLEDTEVDHMWGIARKHAALVLDLRDNPGGAVVTLERMVGNVFDHDVTIAKRIGRKGDMKPQLAKTRGKDHAFAGKLFVLVNSRSASAAELFARTIQLEHRGVVVGDRSSGSVMESRGYSYQQGADTIITYGASITDADLIMADGKSLERTGVIPDELVIPTAKDIAAGRDPAMARAADLAGLKLDAQATGKMFPFEWRPQ